MQGKTGKQNIMHSRTSNPTKAKKAKNKGRGAALRSHRHPERERKGRKKNGPPEKTNYICFRPFGVARGPFPWVFVFASTSSTATIVVAVGDVSHGRWPDTPCAPVSTGRLAAYRPQLLPGQRRSLPAPTADNLLSENCQSSTEL